MKKLSLFPLLAMLTWLAVAMTGCGGSEAPTPRPNESTDAFAFLRSETTAAGVTPQQQQAARRAAKLAQAMDRQAITDDPPAANIYVMPLILDSQGSWSTGMEHKVSNKAAAYTSVHLSLSRTSIVFAKLVDGYSQIFTSIPSNTAMMAEALQLTSDAEQHWTPHISADGSKVVFTKPDPKSSGGLVCVMNNAAKASEDCLDFSSTTPMLEGAYVRHASWSPDGNKIVFEAWGGPLDSDDIFMVNADGRGLTQITSNAGTSNYDECPSVSVDGARIAVATWNDTTQHYEINGINLQTRQRSKISTSLSDTKADAWDPLFTRYTVVWVSQQANDSSSELYMNSSAYGPQRVTSNASADYFDSSSR